MKPEEFSTLGRPPAPEESTLASETPEAEALLRHYRARARARRRRRRMRIAGLLGGAVLVITVLSVLPRAREGRVMPPSSSATSATSAGPPARAALQPSPRTAGPFAPESSTVAPVTTAPRLPATPPKVSTRPAVTVRPHPGERLTAIRTGDPKERVFDLFGSTVQRQGETLIRIDGMRLRARGRSPDHPKLEVADVEVAERGRTQRYWFLFGDGYLIAWGRPDEWPVTAARLQPEIAYR